MYPPWDSEPKSNSRLRRHIRLYQVLLNDHTINDFAPPQTVLENGVLPSQQLEGELSRPPGFDSPEGHGESESVKPPSGFEKFRTAKPSKQNSKRQHHFVERRMTRSQMKVGKSSSQVTTESTRKLAEESLAIGEILGIKVIAKEKEAKRRIADSLKVEKKKRSNLNKGL